MESTGLPALNIHITRSRQACLRSTFMDAVGFLFVGTGLAVTHASLYRREQVKLEAWVPPGTAALRGRALPGASGQRVEGLKFLGSRGGSEIRPQGPVPLSLCFLCYSTRGCRPTRDTTWGSQASQARAPPLRIWPRPARLARATLRACGGKRGSRPI